MNDHWVYDDFKEPESRKPYPCDCCEGLTSEIAFCERCGAPLFDPDEDLGEHGERLFWGDYQTCPRRCIRLHNSLSAVVCGFWKTTKKGL